jgi:hypothetical protein
MLAIFGKKKLNTERLAHMFAHQMIEMVETGFEDVAGFINDSPEFVLNPCIQKEDDGKFLLVVIAGNFSYMSQHFEDDIRQEVMHYCVDKLAPVFNFTPAEFEVKLKEYRDFIMKVNSPSKNAVYAMSKGVFWKYNLCSFQEDYFKSMRTPNPIFIKNLDEIMRNFLWDWDQFNEKYKLVSLRAA